MKIIVLILINITCFLPRKLGRLQSLQKMESHKMTTLKKVFALFLLIALVACGQKPKQNDSLAGLDQQIEAWRSQYDVPSVAIGVIENGEIKLAKVYSDNVDSNGNPDQNQSFNIASLTKPVFSAVVLKLVNDGILGLDETLFKYGVESSLPDEERHKKLTVRHVLSHKTGFPNWRNMTPSKKLSFYSDPGEKFGYSGEGYEYLRKVVTKKLNANIQSFTDSVLFKPLGMKSSTIGSAAGGMQTTISDYTKFCLYILLNYTNLSGELFSEMMAPQVHRKDSVAWGLGWKLVLNLENNDLAILHAGGSPGVKTFVLLYPKTKSGIVVFTDSDSGTKVYEKIFRAYSADGNEVFEKLNKRSVPDFIYKIPTESLSNYAGIYNSDMGFNLEVYIEDDKLKLEIPGMPVYTLYAQSNNTFILDESFNVEFERNSSDEITSMIIYQNGIPLFFKKG